MHGDEAYTLYFNTKGKDNDGELPPAMREILEYIDKPDNYPVRQSGIELIKRIDNAVKVNRQSPEWRRRYMMYQLHVMDIRREAELAGERRGEKRGERQGDRKRQLMMAVKMLTKRHPVEEIIEYTELPLEEVLRIKKEEEDRVSTALDGGEGI
jgi:predicted transposase/invertase (TIGR01784 family)